MAQSGMQKPEQFIMTTMQKAMASVVWHQESELSTMRRTSTFGVKGRREAQNTVQSSGFLPFPTSTWAEESPTGHYKEP